MAKTVEIKIPDDIEYRVIGNAFGLMIAAAGLLAGEMVRMRSIDYWLADIVPLLLTVWLGFRLYRNFLSTMTVYGGTVAVPSREQLIRESIRAEPAALAQITAKTGYSAEQVVEEVARRIEAKKEASMKKIMSGG